jgi:hypothetical protein
MNPITSSPQAITVEIAPTTPGTGVIGFLCEMQDFYFLLSRADVELLRDRLADALAKAPLRASQASSDPAANSPNK